VKEKSLIYDALAFGWCLVATADTVYVCVQGASPFDLDEAMQRVSADLSFSWLYRLIFFMFSLFCAVLGLSLARRKPPSDLHHRSIFPYPITQVHHQTLLTLTPLIPAPLITAPNVYTASCVDGQ
jgi:hypothetical protein